MLVLVVRAHLPGSAPTIMTTADRFSSPNRSNHTNPTHYGSPLDSPSGSPPINCRLDEDGVILDSFVYNPQTGAMEQVEFMWCAPNLTRMGAARCPTDVPAGATTAGASPMTAAPAMNESCFLSCVQDSDCGGGALCADETNRTINGTHIPAALPANMCAWQL